MLTFTEISKYQGANLTCSNCNHITVIPETIRMTVGDNIHDRLEPYQCNECGEIKRFLLITTTENERLCECGGVFTRDKPLFCGKCKYNKI